MGQDDRVHTTVALLGVGRMGAPMAARLVDAGFTVRLWNRSSARVLPLVEAGASGAATPAEAVTGADLVITMLPDGSSVEAVMRGPDGALTATSTGTIWLQMSSVGVEWADRLAAMSADAGVGYVDAPVSGSVGPAETGTLLILASGPDDLQDAVAPVLDVLGRQTVWLGSAGAGSRAKLVLNNWLVDLVESVVEALHFSEALGLDPHLVVDMLDGAPIGSPYAVAKARLMLAGEFAPSFALKHAVKDAGLALEAAEASGTDLRVTASFIEPWRRAVAEGSGDQDVAAAYECLG